MMSQKKCQCGAVPRYATVRGASRGFRRESVRERLECPFCGNATAAGLSRELIAREWETAGWCGQAEYLPGGLQAYAKRTALAANRAVREMRELSRRLRDSARKAYRRFAELHPDAAYRMDRRQFIEYARSRNKSLTAAQIDAEFGAEREGKRLDVIGKKEGGAA